MAGKPDNPLLTLASALRPDEREGVAQSVVNRILDMVRTGNLRAGDRLPSERELIEIFGISRPSLREALRALAMLGVIETRHGGGAFVTSLEARTLLAPLDFFLSLSPANLADAVQSRRIVEVEMVRMAAAKATRAVLADLDDMIAAHEAAAGDPVGFRILDARFHLQLWEAAGNAVLERIAYGLYTMGLEFRRRATEHRATIRESAADHARIVAAIHAGDVVAAGEAMNAHLDHIETSTRRAMGLERSARRRD